MILVYDDSGQHGDVTYATEVSSDSGLELGLTAWEVLAVFNRRPETQVDTLPVRATEHRAGAEQRQRIILGTGVVNCDVPEHVLSNLLGQVNVDTEEVR